MRSWCRSGRSPRRGCSMADLIGDLTAELASLRDDLDSAYVELEEADEEWLAKYDDSFEVMREEAQERGSKAEPPEHAVTAHARKAHPSEYRRWKKAKREIQRLTTQAENVRAQVSAHQTRAREAGRLPTVQPRQGPRAVA